MQQRADDIKMMLERDQIYKKRTTNLELSSHMPIPTQISKRWVKKGQQNNKVRVLLCRAFENTYENSENALEIRRFTVRSTFFDEKHRNKDNKYKSIISRIQTVRKGWGAGMYEDIMNLEGNAKRVALKAKSVSLTGRGRKPLHSQTKTEKTLMVWLEERWAKEQRVSRTMVFRKVLENDPKFCGGVKSDGYLDRMKTWFYYGLKIRFDLSNRKIAGAGQKLPDNWEQALVDMRGKVRAKQQPVRRADGTVRIDGVKDAYFCNTDHVPVWYESVGNYSWGKKNSGRRHVRTGGKEKDRFTAQLSVGKGGKKLIPFLIFKGEFETIC